jgi:DNA polymerase-1
VKKNVKVNKDNYYKVVDEINSCDTRSLDTETYGLAWEDGLFNVIIGTHSANYSFNYIGSGPSALSSLHKSNLQDLLYDKTATWFIHNAKFDMHKLALEGAYIKGKVHCSYVTERLIRNNLMSLSLEACSKRRALGVKVDKVKEYITKHKLYDIVLIPGKKKREKLLYFDKVPEELMFEYGCQDASLHYDLGMRQLQYIDKHPSLKDLYENELELIKVCFAMEQRGIKVDEGYVRLALGYEQGKKEEALNSFTSTTNEVYKDSSILFTKLFDKEGTQYPLTEKGRPSFKGDFLDTLSTPLAKSINKIRYHEKRIGTYYTSFLHYMDKGRVLHAGFNQAGTVTGRFSSSNPNLQNVPKEEEGVNPFPARKSFIPREGYVYHALDYDQQEYRVMLDYAGEAEVIASILKGEDVHTSIANMVGISRKLAKTLSFAILYGAGIAKIAQMLGVSQAEASSLRDQYFARLPMVRQFIHRVKRMGEVRGHVFNFVGREFHIDNKNEAYRLPNHLIQGTCADVIKFAMVKVHKLLEGTKSAIIMQVHDELLIETHMEDLGLIPGIKNIMENIYKPKNKMKLTVSVEHSLTSFAYCDKVKGIYGRVHDKAERKEI